MSSNEFLRYSFYKTVNKFKVGLLKEQYSFVPSHHMVLKLAIIPRNDPTFFVLIAGRITRIADTSSSDFSCLKFYHGCIFTSCHIGFQYAMIVLTFALHDRVLECLL
jgi:hypothetical protein